MNSWYANFVTVHQKMLGSLDFLLVSNNSFGSLTMRNWPSGTCNPRNVVVISKFQLHLHLLEWTSCVQWPLVLWFNVLVKITLLDKTDHTFRIQILCHHFPIHSRAIFGLVATTPFMRLNFICNVSISIFLPKSKLGVELLDSVPPIWVSPKGASCWKLAPILGFILPAVLFQFYVVICNSSQTLAQYPYNICM